MNTKLSDNQLVEQFKAGSEEAFEELYRRYRKIVGGIAYRILRDHWQTEDAIQDTFIQVYNKIDQFKFESKFSSWLYRVASNQALTIKRLANTKGRQSTQLAEDVGFSMEAVVGEEFHDSTEYRHEIRKALVDAISHLEPTVRLIFLLAVVDGYSNPEIMNELNITLGKTKSSLHYARVATRKRIQRYLDKR